MQGLMEVEEVMSFVRLLNLLPTRKQICIHSGSGAGHWDGNSDIFGDDSRRRRRRERHQILKRSECREQVDR